MILADRLVQELMLVSVLVAGEGAEALAASLEAAGAAAEALLGDQAPQGFDLAILLTHPAHAATAQTRALVDILAHASDRLLLVPLPLGEAHAGAAPALPELPVWFELLAERGYQPVIEFDASFISPGAFLVDRAATADEGDLAAFTDRLQLGPEAASAQREAVAEAERNVRTELHATRVALADAEDALARARAEAAAAQVHITDLTSRAAGLAEATQAAETALAAADQRNAGWDALRSWVRLLAASATQNTLAGLARDLPYLNALRAPDLPPIILPNASPRTWRARFLRTRTAPTHPVLHDAALVRASPHFDAAWYIAANPDAFASVPIDPVFHYVVVGAPRGLDPGPWFDAAAYVGEHPAAAGRALVHAIGLGK